MVIFVIVGFGFTVKVTIVVFVQTVSELLPVTVYVVVMVGVAVTVTPVVTFKNVAGAQVYVLAPLAVRDVDAPAQIVVEGVAVTVNEGAKLVI